MADEYHVLLVPVTGILHVVHDERKIDLDKTLAQFDGEGPTVLLNARIDQEPSFIIAYMHNPVGPVNPRARSALAELIGAHMVFTGPVAFVGLTPEQTFHLVGELS